MIKKNLLAIAVAVAISPNAYSSGLADFDTSQWSALINDPIFDQMKVGLDAFQYLSDTNTNNSLSPLWTVFHINANANSWGGDFTVSDQFFSNASTEMSKYIAFNGPDKTNIVTFSIPEGVSVLYNPNLNNSADAVSIVAPAIDDDLTKDMPIVSDMIHFRSFAEPFDVYKKNVLVNALWWRMDQGQNQSCDQPAVVTINDILLPLEQMTQTGISPYTEIPRLLGSEYPWDDPLDYALMTYETGVNPINYMNNGFNTDYLAGPGYLWSHFSTEFNTRYQAVKAGNFQINGTFSCATPLNGAVDVVLPPGGNGIAFNPSTWLDPLKQWEVTFNVQPNSSLIVFPETKTGETVILTDPNFCGTEQVAIAAQDVSDPSTTLSGTVNISVDCSNLYSPLNEMGIYYGIIAPRDNYAFSTNVVIPWSDIGVSVTSTNIADYSFEVDVSTPFIQNVQLTADGIAFEITSANITALSELTDEAVIHLFEKTKPIFEAEIGVVLYDEEGMKFAGPSTRLFNIVDYSTVPMSPYYGIRPDQATGELCVYDSLEYSNLTNSDGTIDTSLLSLYVCASDPDWQTYYTIYLAQRGVDYAKLGQIQTTDLRPEFDIQYGGLPLSYSGPVIYVNNYSLGASYESNTVIGDFVNPTPNGLVGMGYYNPFQYGKVNTNDQSNMRTFDILTDDGVMFATPTSATAVYSRVIDAIQDATTVTNETTVAELIDVLNNDAADGAVGGDVQVDDSVNQKEVDPALAQAAGSIGWIALLFGGIIAWIRD